MFFSEYLFGSSHSSLLGTVVNSQPHAVFNSNHRICAQKQIWNAKKANFVWKNIMVTQTEAHAFLDAAKSFDWVTVFDTLETSPEMINVQTCQRWTAMHQGAFCANPAVVRGLLDRRADINLLTKDRATPYQIAGQWEYASVPDSGGV